MNNNIIFFGYDSQLTCQLIDEIKSFYSREEQIKFLQVDRAILLKADSDDIDDIEENIIVYESDRLPQLKLVDITQKHPDLKDKIWSSCNSNDNNIFVCVLSDKYLLKNSDKKLLRIIYSLFEKEDLDSFFCITNVSNPHENHDSYYDYIRSELNFIFRNEQNSFDYSQYNKRVFFLPSEEIAENSKFLEFMRELKECYEENREEISKPSTRISSLINSIIEERGKQVCVVNNYLDNINNTDKAIKELKSVLSELLCHPQVTEELKFRIQEFESVSASWSGEIVSSLNRFENVKNRLARQTVTIGCSGQARVGKSTLLQTIGTLPEEAVPTGKGIPVTAVRSRLRHSQERKAILSLRDKKTLIDELIKPFHRELNLPDVNCFEDFKNFDYDSNRLATDENIELSTRLKQMQAALSSYEGYLTGKTKEIEDLNQLRPWVAYPTQEEANSHCSRLYLAVKDIEIQCSFLLDVEKLMLVDLPGLGEVNVDAEEHHIQGLKNEVDLVLLVLRPTAQSSYWSDKNRKTLNLISQAVEGISRLGDFVIIVVNHGEQDDKELYNILVNDIHKQLNENEPNSRYKVLTCNALKADSVRENVLVPVLNHSIEHLTVMDKDIINSSFIQWQTTSKKINIAIEKLKTSLESFSSQGISRSGKIDSKAKLLREKLSIDLGKEIQELKTEIEKEKTENSIIDSQLIMAIEDKHKQIQDWSINGLGLGKQEWCDKARSRFDLDKTVNAFAVEEINSSRAYLTNVYSDLNIYFETKIEYLWKKISNIISTCMGDLIRETPAGREVLEKFILCLEGEGIGDPFPSLQEATKYLLKCGTENAIFQSHLLLRLVEETQKLAPERIDFTNISYQDKLVEEKVLKRIFQKTIQTSFTVQKVLKTEPFISNIIYSAAVKFEDSLVRARDADRQFFDFASLYANEIWPDEFHSFEKSHAMVKKAEQTVTKLERFLINSLEG